MRFAGYVAASVWLYVWMHPRPPCRKHTCVLYTCRKGKSSNAARVAKDFQHAALRAGLGLFDVPLMPYVLVPSESIASIAEYIAFVESDATSVDVLLRCPSAGCRTTQDTESMWASMTHVIKTKRESRDSSLVSIQNMLSGDCRMLWMPPLLRGLCAHIPPVCSTCAMERGQKHPLRC